MSSLQSQEVLLSLLRTAMRQWGAFLETQIAIERAIGVEGSAEIGDYIVDLAPEFVDHPERLESAHVRLLLERFSESEQPPPQ